MQQLPAAISKGVNTEFTRLLLKNWKRDGPVAAVVRCWFSANTATTGTGAGSHLL